ncbi:hypothetical protein [Nostoc sp.]
MKFALSTKSNLWEKLQQELKLWREVVLPGLSVIGLIILVRSTGLLQSQE